MQTRRRPILIVFGGLPGTGKSTLARMLATELGAVYLRIDSIEQALRNAGSDGSPVYDEGYRVAYAVAQDNLRLGHSVVSDSVNPVAESRDAWVHVARGVHVPIAEVEVVCSDPRVHRQRVESRSTDIPGLNPPSWEAVVAREYEPWSRNHIIIDTAGRSVDACFQELRAALPK